MAGIRKGLIKMSTPEEAELAGKKAELERLSDVLAEKELDLEELKLTVARFQHRYYSEVGKRYVELDELRAQIAELKAERKPQDHEMNQEATRARTQARKATEEYEDIDIEPQADSKSSEESAEAKKLYRKIASIIHPDKATDDNSRHLRTRLMAELNEAYAQKDIAKMQSVLDKWQESPEAISGEDTGAELVRAIRAIAQIKRRISEIETEISETMTSDIHELMAKVHSADLAGRDILAEMSAGIDFEIQGARNELAGLNNV
jgi:cell pole-organizing protein PopZ